MPMPIKGIDHRQASTERSGGSPAEEQIPFHRETHPEGQFSGSEDIVRRKDPIVRLATAHRSRGRFVRRTGNDSQNAYRSLWLD
jgi:hypothetical protein